MGIITDLLSLVGLGGSTGVVKEAGSLFGKAADAAGLYGPDPIAANQRTLASYQAKSSRSVANLQAELAAARAKAATAAHERAGVTVAVVGAGLVAVYLIARGGRP